MNKSGIGILAGVCLSVLSYGVFVLCFSKGTAGFGLEKFGQFGDSFGLLTSLFSGLAFCGLIITILLQKKELQLQREELGLTREELVKSREAQQEQVEQMSKAAKLNALCTLSQVYTDMSLQEKHAISTKAQEAVPLRNEYIEQLRKLTNENV